MEGPTTKRNFREKLRKGKVEKCTVWGVKFCIFELPRLDFLQFQQDFRSFSDKKGLLLGGQNPSVERGGGNIGAVGRGRNIRAGGGGLWPLQYIC